MFSPDEEVDESFKMWEICKNCGRGCDMADRGSSDQCGFGCGDKLECEGFWCGLLSHSSYELVKATTRYCQASSAIDCRRMDSVRISSCRNGLHPVELHSCIWARNCLRVLISFSSPSPSSAWGWKPYVSCFSLNISASNLCLSRLFKYRLKRNCQDIKKNPKPNKSWIYLNVRRGSIPATGKSLRVSFIYWDQFSVLSHIINVTLTNIYIQDRCS